MNTKLNNDKITMIIERAKDERAITIGLFIASTMHKLLDWMEKGSENTPQGQAARQSGYHLNSEGSRTRSFDTSAFG